MKLLCPIILSASLIPANLAGIGQQTVPTPSPAATLPPAQAAGSASSPAATSPSVPQQSGAPSVLGAPSAQTAPAPGSVQVLPAPSNAAPQLSSQYVIGPDDSLQVTVWKEPGLSGSFPVRPDGMISLSLVGDIHAAGLTPAELGSEIAVHLKKFVNDPLVNVTVLAVNSRRVFLLGEVQHIGALPLTPGMTPLQALSAAGGLTAYANAKHIYILRGEQGKQQKIPFNYKKAIKDGNEQGVSLLPGDTIVVP